MDKRKASPTAWLLMACLGFASATAYAFSGSDVVMQECSTCPVTSPPSPPPPEKDK